jgi:hypothetical protein
VPNSGEQYPSRALGVLNRDHVDGEKLAVLSEALALTSAAHQAVGLNLIDQAPSANNPELLPLPVRGQGVPVGVNLS